MLTRAALLDHYGSSQRREVHELLKGDSVMDENFSEIRGDVSRSTGQVMVMKTDILSKKYGRRRCKVLRIVRLRCMEDERIILMGGTCPGLGGIRPFRGGCVIG